MNQRRFPSQVRVFSVTFFILLSLVASGCGGPATEAPTEAPATEAPTEAATEAPATEAPATEAPASNLLTCSEGDLSLDPEKPPLSLDQLPQPEDPLLFDPDRVIGFNFPDGWPALIASPAQAECLFNEASGWGQALGVVWKFDPESHEPTGYILAVDPTQPEDPANPGILQGKLVRLDLTEAEDITIFRSALTKQTEQETEPIDVSIWAGAVCFRVDQNDFCTSGSTSTALDVRSFQSEKYQTIIAEVKAAEQQLIDMGIILPERDTVLYDRAISEIELPSRIEACNPGNTETPACQADIILAPIASDNYPASGEPWGVVVVVQELTLPDTDVVIPPGDYAVLVELGSNGELVSAKLEGVTETEEPLSEEVPAVLTPYVDSTGNAGQAGIFTCSLGKICLFWECK